MNLFVVSAQQFGILFPFAGNPSFLIFARPFRKINSENSLIADVRAGRLKK